MCNRACVGSLCSSILRARTFQQLQILLQGDFLRVGLPQRRAKSRKGFRRSPNQCGVLRGQMAKVDLRTPPEKAVAAVTATPARTKAMCASGFMLLLLRLLIGSLCPNAKGRGVPLS